MELVRFPSRGGFSVRSIFTFALATILVALLWTIFSNTTTHAESGANWSGDSIIYANHGYTKAEAGSFKDTSGTIPADTTVYKTPVQTVGTGAAASQKVFIIYFSSGVDPPTATSAQYIEFDYKNGSLSNPQNQKTISITVQGEQTSFSSCSVDGVGWFICPISVFLADSMDKLFDILTGFIETQPLVLNDPNSSMYVAWNMMRTVANIAFVIVFLLIIYSQLTSLGVSNYGIKKMIPRLVVAAVLVNISFYVCAIAIDISNILGYSIQNVFHSISQATFHLTNDDVGSISRLESPWSKLTAVVLAGGGVVGGVFYLANGGIALLMPLLLGLILTVIMVVVILAARQAIIVMMVIVAPLAFVANLLPNTEKWFDKWKDLFFTMLIFFPAFSFVFGASQMAGQIIIQNAGDNIVMLIFGVAVQIAPLVITPLLLKLSGNLLGKITQIANNPRKGMIDKSRATAQQRAELTRMKNVERGFSAKNPARWGAGMVRQSEYRKRDLKKKLEIANQGASNQYEQSKRYNKLNEKMAKVDTDKESIHNEHGAHIDHLKSTPGTKLNTAARRFEESKYTAEGSQNTYTAYMESLKESPVSPIGEAARFAETSKAHVESAQGRVQAVFDRERRTDGSTLNLAHVELEQAKSIAEESKSLTAVYTSKLKSELNGSLHTQYVQTEAAKATAQTSEAELKAVIDEYGTGYTPSGANPALVAAITTINTQRQALSIEAARTSNAQKVQNEHLADALINNSDLRDAAGGINEQGSDAALANAINTVRKSYGESVSEARAIIKHFNVASNDRQILALLKDGEEITVTRDDGTSHTFTSSDIYAREAAIEDQVSVGTIDQVEEIVMASGISKDPVTGEVKKSLLADYRTTISETLAKAGLGSRTLYLGGKTIDDVAWGRINGEEDILALAVEAIAKGRISEKDLASIDPVSVKRFFEAAERIKSGNIPALVEPKFLDGIEERLAEFSEVARNTLVSEERGNIRTKARPYIEKIGQLS